MNLMYKATFETFFPITNLNPRSIGMDTDNLSTRKIGFFLHLDTKSSFNKF